MHNYEIIFMIESMICSLGAIIIKILPELVVLVHFGRHNYLTLITLNKKKQNSIVLIETYARYIKFKTRPR